MEYVSYMISKNEFSAPALARGLAVLERLQRNRCISLDELSLQENIPKASLLRLLKTLEATGYVHQAPDKTWASDVQIVRAGGTGCLQHIPRILERLAEETELTAEWYLPSEHGLLLMEQRFPQATETRVVARRGFIRLWNEELDCVAQIGMSVWNKKVTAGCTSYGPRGELQTMPIAKARQYVSTAGKAGRASDHYFNVNGVRRCAVAVYENGQAVGVLALAECLRPVPAHNQDDILEIIQEILCAYSI